MSLPDPETFLRRCVSADAATEKLHLRVERVGAVSYRVLSLRPATELRFATNRYHDTWHILSRPAGAALLSRLLWALSFQEREGTLVAIHGEHLTTTPFEGDRSDPILLVPSRLTPVSESALGALRLRLARRRAPDATVKLRCFSLDEALTGGSHNDGSLWMRMRDEVRGAGDRLVVRRLGGCICVSGSALRLRRAALEIAFLARPLDAEDSSYSPLGDSPRGGRCHVQDGEVQVFGDFDRHVAEALVARREVSATCDAPEAPGERQRAIQLRRQQITEQRRESTLACRRVAARRARGDAAASGG